MIRETQYVPILKGKKGELEALQRLKLASWDVVVPIIEIAPIDFDHELEQPKKSLAEHLEPIPEKLHQAWMGVDGSSLFQQAGLEQLETLRPLFVDTVLLGDETLGDGRHPLVDIVERGRALGIACHPVTSYGYGENSWQAARALHQSLGCGCCIRLKNDDQEAPNQRIGEVQAAIGASDGEIDLVIDLGEISAQQVQPMFLAVRAVLQELGPLERWRSLVLAGSSFPTNLSGVERDSFEHIDRAEWALWQRVLANRSRFDRLPSFGDYGINHPDYQVIDPRLMQASGNLRYTCESTWLIVKGRGLKSEGYEQMRGLCHTLVERPEYCGPEFSQGDEWINQCSQGEGPGNQTTWRYVGTNHHLEYVVEQLASLSEPST